MIKITEEENISFYRDYNISEWREKSLVLDENTRNIIINDLTNGVESPLVTLAKLPFPKFICAYLKTFNEELPELNNPELGYKLYLLDDADLIKMFEFLKTTTNAITLNDRYLTNYKASEFFELPLEKISKLYTITDVNSTIFKKWIYIKQYIDAQEAEKLKLQSFEFYDQGQYKGSNLEAKMNLLNPAGRLIVAKYLGLYGNFRKPIMDLSAETSIFERIISNYVNLICSYMEKSAAEMCHLLGVSLDSLHENKTRLYENPKAKDIDLKLQFNFIEKCLLSDAERLVLEGHGKIAKKIYMAKKYLFDNDKDIIEYLNIKPKYLQDFNITI